MDFFEDSPVFKPGYVHGIVHDSYKVLINAMTKVFMQRTKYHHSDDWLDGYRTAIEDMTEFADGVLAEKGNNDEQERPENS